MLVGDHTAGPTGNLPNSHSMPACSTRPAVKHNDAVRQRHGLDLVVGDVDDVGREAPVQRPQLHAHLVAQGRIEIGQRLDPAYRLFFLLPSSDGRTSDR